MSSRKISNSSLEDDRETNRYAKIDDEKKRKRMISNRESARRSRMKREQHIKDLNDETTYFNTKRSEMLQKICDVANCYAAIKSENKILRMQAKELKRRLQVLEDMLAFCNTNNSSFVHDLQHGIIAKEEHSKRNNLMKTLQPQPIDGSIYHF